MSPFIPVLAELPTGQLVKHPQRIDECFGNEPQDLRLVDSIAELGIRRPLIVSLQRNGSFRIVDGYRRYRAASQLGMASVPCVVHSKLCSIDRCKRLHCGRGFCTMHLARYRKHGDPQKVCRRSRYALIATRFCSIERCGEPHVARGLCRRHYDFNRRRVKWYGWRVAQANTARKNS